MRLILAATVIVIAAMLCAPPLLLLEGWIIHLGGPSIWFDPPRPIYWLAKQLVPEGGPAGYMMLIILENFFVLLIVFGITTWAWLRRGAKPSSPKIDA